jgi:hypothetical protein
MSDPTEQSARHPALAALPVGPAIARLLAIMAKLRDPDGGCPWDVEQSFETIAPYIPSRKPTRSPRRSRWPIWRR